MSRRPSPRHGRVLCALAAGALLLPASPTATAGARQRVAHAPKAAAARHEPARDTYARRADVMRQAAALADEFGLERRAVEGALAQARHVPAVARLIMPPPAGTAKNWSAYRARFIDAARVRAGAEFWDHHAHWLHEAERRWGVPPEVVIGILGVETYYGRLTGNFRVLDALATLAFDFPSGRSDRSAFFRNELGQFLRLAQREGFAPESVKGSFAGAIGLGQFMPGSILRYAIDFDGDGHVDMARSAADVIGSIAHYLAEHGWQPGLPTHYAVQPPEDPVQRAALLMPDILPVFSAQDIQAQGARLEPAAQAHAGPLALVQLHNGDATPSYVAGTQNFYAVTRYNWSSYYALAVIELGQIVGATRQLGR